MHFSSLLMASLLGAASAVDVQVVYVGWNPANNATGNNYWPDNITAEPGSMVQFQFWTGNHTVTQSSFDSPCTPLEAVNGTGNGTKSAMGIKSGFQPVEASMADGEIPVFSVMVNDTSPLWFYCGQSTHCQGGMSMVINEKTSSGKTLASYQSASAALLTGGDGSSDGGEDGTGDGSGSGSGSGSDSDSGSGSGSGSGTGDSSGDGSADGSTDGGDVPVAMGSGLALPSTLLLLIGTALALV